MKPFDPIVSVETASPAQTRALAAALSGALVDGDLLVLTGDLGAGKTCFTQGLAAGLGIDDRVTSPTFTLANRYEGRLVLNHVDLYRLDGPADVESLGLFELLEDGVTVIEWGDKIETLLPPDLLVVALRYPDRAHEPVHGTAHGWAHGDEFEPPTERAIEVRARAGSSWHDRSLADRLGSARVVT